MGVKMGCNCINKDLEMCNSSAVGHMQILVGLGMTI